jgi:outer membrane immunogenic protein
MNKLFLTGAALLTAITLACPASAADLATKAPPAPAPVCTWCGWYVGLNGGYNWGNAKVTMAPTGLFVQDPNAPFFAAAGSPSFSPSKFSGGGQIGWNSQWGPWVMGIEADAEYIGLRASRTATFTALLPVPGQEIITFNEHLKNDWVSTLRLRGGWANDVLLVYATGGLALSQHRFSQTFAIPNSSAGGGLEQTFTVGMNGGGSTSRLVGGFAVGGGAEFKFTRDWSVRAEYLYIDLGKTRFDATMVCTSGGPGGLCPPAPVGFTTRHEEDMWTNIARLAINYQFPVAVPR